MKTVQITVEKNFHCMNDDRFIMEKISCTIELDGNESDGAEQRAMDDARQQIITNFKAAYPKVYTHLNFDEVIQRDEKLWDELVTKPAFEKTFGKIDSFGNSSTEMFPALKEKSISKSDEKTKTGTIEEQIRASKDLNELDGWKFVAKSNAKLQKIFSNREKELINEETK